MRFDAQDAQLADLFEDSDSDALDSHRDDDPGDDGDAGQGGAGCGGGKLAADDKDLQDALETLFEEIDQADAAEGSVQPERADGPLGDARFGEAAGAPDWPPEASRAPTTPESDAP
eukprot:6821576-Pyramimonas_sp.AAC.1